MNTIIPWQRMLVAVEPHYPRAVRGRRPVPLEAILRIHLRQHFFNYSDPAMEEAMYVVDATLIAAPPSTRNKERKRDPEMGSTKKGNQWYFGMKAHIGVAADSGLLHSTIFTAAKVPDNKVWKELLHGD